jgi:hypothetical protein
MYCCCKREGEKVERIIMPKHHICKWEYSYFCCLFCLKFEIIVVCLHDVKSLYIVYPYQVNTVMMCLGFLCTTTPSQCHKRNQSKILYTLSQNQILLYTILLLVQSINS